MTDNNTHTIQQTMEWIRHCLSKNVDATTAKAIFACYPTDEVSRLKALNNHLRLEALSAKIVDAPDATSKSGSELLVLTNNPQSTADDVIEFESPTTPDIFSGKNVVAISKKKIAVPRGRRPIDFQSRELTAAQQDLFNLSLQIDEFDAKSANEIGYIATAMIHASLPHSRVTALDATGKKIEATIYKKKTNYVQLTIMNDPDIGLPFGKIPRLITAYLCTQAKLKGSRTIDLGNSQADFADKLGLKNSGGSRGDITRLKDQAKRLFSSQITLIGEPGTNFYWRHVNVAEEGNILWNNEPYKTSKWNSELTLNQRFFEECIEHSMPLDMRVIHSLQSCLAIDIYIWLNYRLNSIKAPTRISWAQLKYEFGNQYADDEQGMSNFINKFKGQLKTVLLIYRDAKIDVDSKVLTLFPSKTHIARLS